MLKVNSLKTKWFTIVYSNFTIMSTIEDQFRRWFLLFRSHEACIIIKITCMVGKLFMKIVP